MDSDDTPGEYPCIVMYLPIEVCLPGCAVSAQLSPDVAR